MEIISLTNDLQQLLPRSSSWFCCFGWLLTNPQMWLAKKPSKRASRVTESCDSLGLRSKLFNMPNWCMLTFAVQLADAFTIFTKLRPFCQVAAAGDATWCNFEEGARKPWVTPWICWNCVKNVQLKAVNQINLFYSLSPQIRKNSWSLPSLAVLNQSLNGSRPPFSRGSARGTETSTKESIKMMIWPIKIVI